MSTTLRRWRPGTAALAVAATLVAVCAGACGTAEPPAKQAGATVKPTLDRSLNALLPAAVRDAGVLRVGTDASYAPMSFFGPDGRTIVGMEPDLGVAIGQVLGVRLEFIRTDFTDILPEVQNGQLDVGMSAMTDTAEREKQVDFVNYLSAGTSIVVQRGNPSGVTDLKDLCGKKVALEKGTIQVDLVKRSQRSCGSAPIELSTYATNSDALVQLRTGRAVAVLNDFAPAAYLASDARTKAHYQLASTNQYEPGQYGMAVNKSQPAIRDAIAGALDALNRNGSYRGVLDHWGVTGGAMDDVTVNSGR